ncbi:MAG: site-2 protease family protein, partial [Planctomycetota bacterium]
IGLLPGDRVKKVHGVEVRSHWELMDIVEDALVPEVTLSAEREDEAGGVKLVESKMKLELVSDGTGHIYSMVPRMRMEQIKVKKSSRNKEAVKAVLESGDIILGIGEVLCPTYKEFREVITKYEDKELLIKVLRTDVSGIEKPVAISVTPRRHKDVNEVLIGISFFRTYDTEHAVISGTIAVEGGPAMLNIPKGAVITAVDGTPVSNFYDVIREIRRYPGERITIDYRVNEQMAGSVALDVETEGEPITVQSTFAEYVPFAELKRLYKADNPIEAIGMGYKKTIMFITQTYLTLRRLVGRDVSPKSLMGPVGILAVSYTAVAERPFVYYMYFLGLISACIAVVNFLPLPPLDGGLVVLLLVEKVKGSALSEKTQGIIAYAGWVFIGTFFLYVTFNDVVRTFFS